MQRNPLPNADRYTKQNSRRRIWKKIVGTLACVVVFCTTYALILPAITQEREAYCGYEEHTHDISCYTHTSVNQTLICTPETLGVHSHSEACYDESGNLICGKADHVAHTHNSLCYDQAGQLVCQFPEIVQHEHTENCYAPAETEAPVLHVHTEACYVLEQGELICEQEEKESHTHGDACYTSTLTCTLEENEGHSHGESCYTRTLTCELSEEEGHTHTADCYAWSKVTACGLEEGEAEAVPEQELVLICTEPVLESHIHSEETCIQTTADDSLTCTLEENADHQHTELCYGTWKLTCGLEEHTHELSCYSNAEADLETEEDWLATFANAELTGIWSEDVLTIAKTQLGYTESVDNYVVWEDGTTHGYTRYGEWYGIPHGDWCGMFVSFCLHYGGMRQRRQSDFRQWRWPQRHCHRLHLCSPGSG